jgi:hypothetical protein
VFQKENLFEEAIQQLNVYIGMRRIVVDANQSAISFVQKIELQIEYFSHSYPFN